MYARKQHNSVLQGWRHNINRIRQIGTVVYEFGQRVDLSREDDVRTYIEYYGRWIDSIRWPRTLQSFIEFAHTHTYDKRHREIALLALAQSGHVRSKAILHAYKRKITSELFEEARYVKQGFLEVLAGVSLGVFTYVYAVPKITQLGARCATVVDAVDLAGTINSTYKSAVEAAKAFYKWCKEQVLKMAVLYADIPATLRWIVERFVLVLAVATAVTMAITLIPQWAVAVKEYLVRKLKTPDPQPVLEAQSKLLGTTLDYVGQGFSKNVKSFSTTFSDLPKVVSIAKAFGWIFDNISLVLKRLLEWLSGEVVAEGALEVDIAKWSNDVEMLLATLEGASSYVLYSHKTKTSLKGLLDYENVILGNAARRDKNLRAPFAAMLVSGRRRLEEKAAQIERLRTQESSRPEPVWVYIHGKPGIGKSYSANKLQKHVYDYVRQKGSFLPEGEYTDNYVYNWTGEDEFYDGYKNQFFTYVDDLFQSKDPTKRNSMATALINMVSCMPYSLLMADMKDKSGVYFTSRVILTMSNMGGSFAGEDLGLTDHVALEDRRSVVFEAISTDGIIEFKLAPQYSCDDGKKTVFNIAEAAALIGELVLAKEIGSVRTCPTINFQTFGLKYVAPRVQINGGTRKEAAELPRATGTVRPPPRNKRSWKGQVLSFIDTNAPLTTQLTFIDTDPMVHARCGVEHARSFFRNIPTSDYLSAVNQLVGAMVRYYETNGFPPAHWIGLATAVNRITQIAMCTIYDLGDNAFANMSFYQSFVMLRSMVFVHTLRGQGHEDMEKGKEIEGESELPPLEEVDEESYFDVDVATIERVMQSRANISEFCRYASRTAPAKKKVRFHHADMALLQNLPKPCASMLFMTFPEYFLPPVVGYDNDYKSTYMNAMCDMSLSNRYFDLYARIIDKNRVEIGDWTPTYWEQIHSKRMKGKSIVLQAIKWISGITLALGLVYAAFKLLFPARAYEAQVAYDPNPKIAKHAFHQRAKARDQKVMKRFVVQGGIQDQNVLISSAITTLMVRYVRPGASHDEVKNAAVCTGSYAMWVFDRKLLVPMHVVFEQAPEDHDIWISTGENRGHVIWTNLSTDDYRNYPIIKLGSDLCLLEVPDSQPRRDISGHFADAFPTYGKIQQLLPLKTSTGVQVTVATSHILKQRTVVQSADYKFDVDLEIYQVPNEPGYCGIPYTHRTTGKIVGIHLAGDNGDWAAAGLLFKGDLLPHKKQTQVLFPTLGDFEEAPLIPGVDVVGKLSGQSAGYIPTETALRLSAFDVASFPFPETTDMPAKLKREGTLSPLYNSLRKFEAHETWPRPIDLDFSDYANHVDRSLIRFMTLDEAVYGIPGYIDALDVTTSSGYFEKRKGRSRKDIFYSPDGRRQMCPLFRKEVEIKWRLLGEGHICAAVYEDTLKDEIRTLDRVNKASSRLFSSCDLVTLVLSKMTFGILYHELDTRPSMTHLSLGLNPHSREWGELYSRISAYGFDICMGDASQFDLSNHIQGEYEFIEFLKSFFPLDEQRVEATLKSSRVAYHVCGPIVYTRNMSTRSGEFNTSHANTFFNNSIHKQAFKALGHSQEEWIKENRPTFHGDDSGVGSKDKRYTMPYLSKYFNDVHGVEYTAPDKSNAVSANIHDYEYLKRKFVVTEYGVMAPLNAGSISNIVKWTNRPFDKIVSRSVLESVLLEAWHYGEEKYNEVYQWCQKENSRLGINAPLKNWNSMKADRLPAYRGKVLVAQGAPPKYEVKRLVTVMVPGNEAPAPNSFKPHVGVGFAYSYDAKLFNMTTEKTETQSINTTQSDSPQELTSPVSTSLYQTPAMSFGEVGETAQTIAPGHSGRAHGVGHFKDTQLLERMVKLVTLNWTTDDPIMSQLYTADIDNMLRNVARNQAVLSQFTYFRANVEVSVRLNTNQFYYGALMFTMWPSNATGESIDARAVLDPAIITASSAESVIKTVEYPWPMAWKFLRGGMADSYPINMSLDILAPLTAAKASMPSTITVQIWARFTNVELSYPYSTLAVFKGQSRAYPKVVVPQKPRVRSPAKDSASRSQGGTKGNSLDKAVDAIESITIKDFGSAIYKAASFVADNLGAIAMAVFDKPDREVCQDPVINEASIDMFNTDIPDTNVSIGMYKSRYCDPGAGRMPMTKNFTVSGYAQIPGLRAPTMAFVNEGDSITYRCFSVPTTSSIYRIPLDYAWLNSMQWRGSVKVCLMFFTSSFISARMVVSYINDVEFSGSFPTDYSSGVSKVINVKGDTIDTFTLPWMSSKWWATGPEPVFNVTVESLIANVDSTVDPQIYLSVWIAGGPDIQFAFPRVVPVTEWNGTVSELKGQAAPGSLFKESFPPLGENTMYDIDTGYCTSDCLESITDVCKRYSVYAPPSGVDGFDSALLDTDDDPSAGNYQSYLAFRQTLFGVWRSAFLFRSGGYRYRHFTGQNKINLSVEVRAMDTKSLVPTAAEYITPFDGTERLTIPQLAQYPFGFLGFPIQQLYVNNDAGDIVISDNHPVYLAARDDLQFGFPILPALMMETSLVK